MTGVQTCALPISVPDETVRHMLEESYRLVLAGFSKKKQRELLGEEV